MVLEKDELFQKLFDDPSTNHKELKSDAIRILREWYAKAIFDIVVSRVGTNTENNIKLKINKVPITATNASGSRTRLRNGTQMGNCFEHYISLKAANNEPDIFKE